MAAVGGTFRSNWNFQFDAAVLRVTESHCLETELES